MLVLCKMLGLFLNTLTDDNKFSLLYRDNSTEPIQILLFQKHKIFSEFFSAILKSTLNFEHFQKKVTLIADVFPQLPSPKKGDQINVCKIPFQRCLPQQTWQNDTKTVEICTTLPLPYLFIPVHIIQLQKVYVKAIQNLKTVC